MVRNGVPTPAAKKRRRSQSDHVVQTPSIHQFFRPKSPQASEATQTAMPLQNAQIAVGASGTRGDAAVCGAQATSSRAPATPRDERMPSGMQVPSGGAQATVSPKARSPQGGASIETWGNFGALITAPGPTVGPTVHAGAFGLGYRNALQDRRSPGVGGFGFWWGKSLTLGLPGFRTMLFGGGAGPGGRIPLPVARPGGVPQPDPRHLANLTLLMATAEARFDHLLTAAERALLAQFRALPDAARQLYATLYYLRYPSLPGHDFSQVLWFRCDGALETAAAALCGGGPAAEAALATDAGCFAERPVWQDAALEAVLPLLREPELRAVLGKVAGGAKVPGGYPAMLDALKALCGRSQQTLMGPCGLPGRARRLAVQALVAAEALCVRLRPGPLTLWRRLHVLVFVASGHDPEAAAALLSCDMAALPFPAPLPGPAPCLFGSRAELLRVEEALGLSDRLEAAVQCGDADGAYAAVHEASSRLLPEDMAPRLVGAGGCLEGDGGGGATGAAEGGCGEGGGGGGGQGEGGGRAEGASDAPAPAPAPHPCAAALRASLLARTVWVGIGLLERDRQYPLALHYLAVLLNAHPLSRQAVWRGPCRLRQVRDLLHTGSETAALTACEEALQDPRVVGEHRLELQRLCARLSVPPRRWRTPAFPPLRQAPTRVVTGDAGAGGVEAVALAHYTRPAGWRGMHSENGVFLTLFGLLMWDVIFCDAPGAFQTPWHEAPLDLCLASDDFCGARREAFERAMRQIRGAGEGERGAGDGPRVGEGQGEGDGLREGDGNGGGVACAGGHGAAGGPRAGAGGEGRRGSRPGDGGPPEGGEEGPCAGLLALLRRNWRAHKGRLCVGVNWQRNTLAELSAIAVGLGPAVVAAVCETLASDYRVYRHGFPDLLLWHGKGPDPAPPARSGPATNSTQAATCGPDPTRSASNPHPGPEPSTDLHSEAVLGSRSDTAPRPVPRDTSDPGPGPRLSPDACPESTGSEWLWQCRAKCVEVKGPGDSLSAAQSVWIDVLLSAGAEVEVCHVRYLD